MRNVALSRSAKPGVGVALAVILALTMGGCSAGGQGSNEGAAIETPAETLPPQTEDEVEPEPEEPEPEEPEPELEPPVIWPLTGVETDEVAERPVIGVVIENSPAARPQIGLEYADNVWELVVEGGISRFVALYHSVIPESVAPVRSARSSMIGVMAPLDGVLAYSGAQPLFTTQLRDHGVQTMIMDGGNAGFRRMGTRRAPHNVDGNVQTFLSNASADRAAPPVQQNAFAADIEHSTAVLEGDSLTNLSVRLSGGHTTNWVWDAGTETFLRSNGGNASVAANGTRHAATNVVVLVMQQVMIGGGVPQTIMTGSGPALVATGGHFVTGTWSKPYWNYPLDLRDAAGNEIELAPGQTWLLASTATGGNNWTTSG